MVSVTVNDVSMTSGHALCAAAESYLERTRTRRRAQGPCLCPASAALPQLRRGRASGTRSAQTRSSRCAGQAEGPGAGSRHLDSGHLHPRCEPPAAQTPAGVTWPLPTTVRPGGAVRRPEPRLCDHGRVPFDSKRLKLVLILTSPPVSGERKNSLRT